MTASRSRVLAPRAVGLARVVLGLLVLWILGWTYLAEGSPRLIDFFGYFTNLTSLLASLILLVAGVFLVVRRPAPDWLVALRAVAASCLIIVSVIYNVLVPGTGTAPAWVSMILHAIFPAFVLADWVFGPDRRRLPWNRLWLVTPYPLVWLTVVLIRGATDGWVPYGFLMPEHGAASLALHIAGLLAALLASGALIWGISRWRIRAK